MAIPEAYAIVTGNLVRFLKAIPLAGVPDRVTFEFLKTLGFKSSNDRSIISVLKAIGFLDQNGAPTSLYREFRNPSFGPKVLARALKSAYSDLFLARTDIERQPYEMVRGIVASKTSKGERVVEQIARTFQALAKMADFSESADDTVTVRADQFTESTTETPSQPAGVDDLKRKPGAITLGTEGVAFHYNIQIHLPTTTDLSVYNAIFKSLRENLF